MKTVRQDAWNAEDDERLAEIVLRHIRRSSTQLAAFAESAELLGRTPAACGYRWNACVRKRFLEAIEAARSERTARREEREKERTAEPGEDGGESANAVTWNAVLRFLRQFRREYGQLHTRVRQLEREAMSGRQELERLRKDKQDLLQHLRRLSEEHQVISDDHRALLSIVERARHRQPWTESGAESAPEHADAVHTESAAAPDARAAGGGEEG